MSEQLPRSAETGFDSLAGAETGAEAPDNRPEQAQAETQRTIDHAKAVIAAEAGSNESATLPPIVDDRPLLIDHVAKRIRLRRTLAHVQDRMSPAGRGFSKLVHQPLVQKTSETAAKTVARPSGLLGGGIAAFVGSLIYQFAVRQYGLPYNFSLFIIFFAGGFLLGLFAELLLRKTSR